MLSRADVEYAYRLILGRKPENEAVITQLITSGASFEEMRASFLDSEEFQVNLAASAEAKGPAKGLNWERLNVETDANPDQLAAMVHRVETTWEKLGLEDPHWSVLTNDDYSPNNIEANQKTFFAGGKWSAERMRSAAARCGVRIEEFEHCLELGCGVGRVTIWLARLFGRVTACDVSAPHLEIARQTLANYAVANVELVKLAALAELDDLPPFDAFFSVITLQHNPPPVIAHILRTVLTRLAVGGVAYFQVPTYCVGYEFSGRAYLGGPSATMEMHVLPQESLFALIEEAGCQLLEIREDDATGSPIMVSNSVLVRKRRA